MMVTNNPVLCFDGDCNLCNGFVQWVIKNDPKQRIKFASLQSAFVRNAISDHPTDLDNENSIIYLRDNQVYLRSDAILKLLSDLGGIYGVTTIGYLFPKLLRNQLYNVVAVNRYRILGKSTQCWLPTPELNSRFIY